MGPAGSKTWKWSGAHGQPAPPPYAGAGGGGGGGNGVVPVPGWLACTWRRAAAGSAPRYETRKPRSFWMRSRLLILWPRLGASVLVRPFLGPAAQRPRRADPDLELQVVAGGPFRAELVRQIHYIICEHWGA